MPESEPSQLVAAIKLLKQGDKHAARRLLISILKENPNAEAAWFALSYAVDEPDGKRYALHQVLRINPQHQQAAKLMQTLTVQAQALPIVDQTAAVASESILDTARQQIASGNRLAARAELRHMLRTDENNAAAWFLLSQTAVTQGERKALLRQTLRVDPAHRDAKTELKRLETGPKPVLPPQPATMPPAKTPAPAGLKRRALLDFSKYAVQKFLGLLITVVVGVYITILIANLGGHVDEIMRGMVAQQIMGFVMAGGLDEIPEAEQDAFLEQMEWNLEEAMGLHESFFMRSIRWLFHGLTLNFGDARLNFFFRGIMRTGDRAVQEMVFERLPYTLVLVGAANLLFFFTSLFVALYLSRQYGSFFDRISAALAALSSAPSWIYGFILIVLLAGQLRWLPFPKQIDLQHAEWNSHFLRLMASQMIMPVLAIFLSVFFQGVYAWRTFFLIYSQEDYVEMAKAMGLSARAIERKYILRPTFPYVITNFAMMIITLWETAIALELLFYWPGIGQLFHRAVMGFNNTSTPIIVAIVVIFAYILALTVFILDLVYALIDPKVRIGNKNNHLRAAQFNRSWRQRILDLPGNILSLFQQVGRGFLSFPRRLGALFSFRKRSRSQFWHAAADAAREIRRYPSALVGLVIILILFGVAIYTVIAIPYAEAVNAWRTHGVTGADTSWEKYPRYAQPAWTNLFRAEKLPESLILSSKDEAVEKVYQTVSADTTDITVIYQFEYDYDQFPDEISIFFESSYQEKLPHISLMWYPPDGREIRLNSFSLENPHIYRISQDERLQRKLRGAEPQIGLFADPNIETPTPLKGTYRLEINGITFEPESDFDGDLVIYGQVYGIAGTDHQRRDLKIALLWGTPVALAFGLLGAVGTGLAAMYIAAFGVWHGGWVDWLIQRITEVNIILPTLPIAIMIYIMYSKSIWAILGVIILLNIFGSAIKNYRAAFLQVKEAAYIEGAMAYGADDRRIIFHYLIPRIIPVLLPQLVIMVPGYMFYEATLAYLDLSDPYLPTWGKVVFDAFSNNAHMQGLYYWILEPLGLLLLTGLAFALLGFALDRIINPRLREI